MLLPAARLVRPGVLVAGRVFRRGRSTAIAESQSLTLGVTSREFRNGHVTAEGELCGSQLGRQAVVRG
jgi:hypothetical protein